MTATSAVTAAEAAPARPPLRERKRLKTQGLLYDTAIAMIIDRGYESVTIDDICDAAEVGRATFFRYFGTKSGLMIEFDRRIVENIRAQLDEAMSVREQLTVVERSMADAWSGVHPNVLALGLDYLTSTTVKDMGRVVAGITDVTAEIVQRGIDTGQLRTLWSARDAANHFVMAVRFAIYEDNRDPEDTRLGEHTSLVVEMFLHGMAAPAGPATAATSRRDGRRRPRTAG